MRFAKLMRDEPFSFGENASALEKLSQLSTLVSVRQTGMVSLMYIITSNVLLKLTCLTLNLKESMCNLCVRTLVTYVSGLYTEEGVLKPTERKQRKEMPD